MRRNQVSVLNSMYNREKAEVKRKGDELHNAHRENQRLQIQLRQRPQHDISPDADDEKLVHANIKVADLKAELFRLNYGHAAELSRQKARHQDEVTNMEANLSDVRDKYTTDHRRLLDQKRQAEKDILSLKGINDYLNARVNRQASLLAQKN
jgi:hypothetical protein